MKSAANFYLVIVVIVASAYYVAGDDAPAAAPADPAPAPPAPEGSSPPAPAPASAAAPAGRSITIQLDAPTTVSPDEIAMEEKIGELKGKQCQILFGDCMASLSLKKSYLKDEKRFKICLRKTSGFALCVKMTQENAKQALQEMQTKLKKKWEEMFEKADKGGGTGESQPTNGTANSGKMKVRFVPLISKLRKTPKGDGQEKEKDPKGDGQEPEKKSEK